MHNSVTSSSPIKRRSRRLPAVLLVLAASLAACGGGEAPSPAAAALDDLRSRALVAAGQVEVQPADAAQQLLDYAEKTYPAYFPSVQATQSHPPFVYRFYRETGIYLGVVVMADARYSRLGVYVMGGPFGQDPQHVGPLTGYIQPVPPTR